MMIKGWEKSSSLVQEASKTSKEVFRIKVYNFYWPPRPTKKATIERWNLYHIYHSPWAGIFKDKNKDKK